MYESGLAEAWVIWSGLFALIGGRTTRIAAKLGELWGKEHLKTVLARWSHSTLKKHATAVLKFVEWHSVGWSCHPLT